MVMATTHYNNPAILAEVSEDLGEPMVGIDIVTSEKWALRESLQKQEQNNSICISCGQQFTGFSNNSHCQTCTVKSNKK